MHRTRNLGVVGVGGAYAVGPFINRDGGNSGTNLAALLPATLDVDESFSTVWEGADETLKCSGSLIWVVNGAGAATKPVTAGDSVELRWKGNKGSDQGRDAPDGTVLTGNAGVESEPAIRSYTATVNVNPGISWPNKNMTFTGAGFINTGKKKTSADMNSWAYIYATAEGPRGDPEPVSYRVDGSGWKDMPAEKSVDHTVLKGQEVQMRCLRSGTVEETEIGDVYTISYNIGTRSADATITINAIDLGRGSEE